MLSQPVKVKKTRVHDGGSPSLEIKVMREAEFKNLGTD